MQIRRITMQICSLISSIARAITSSSKLFRKKFPKSCESQQEFV
jgi:hypothetical protein